MLQEWHGILEVLERVSFILGLVGLGWFGGGERLVRGADNPECAENDDRSS